jgi:Putative transposase
LIFKDTIRRFLMHVLPKGFVKVRHFGFLANRGRRENVVLCRKLLAASSTVLPDLTPPPRHSDEPGTAAVDRCPRCKLGSMRMLEILLPQADVMAASGAVLLDTS